ncbi:MAG: DUF4465 domain-containing protein [Cytophagales bacterium]|nr:MAG: DUF4465 domain-containing protein [Cytophagales bacterium]
MLKKTISVLLLSATLGFGQVSNFENLSVIGVNKFWNTDDKPLKGTFEFLDNNTKLPNTFNTGFGGYFSNFVISNNINTTLGGFTNQYSCISGNDFKVTTSDGIFAVAYNDSKIIFKSPSSIAGYYINNSTYAYLSMKNGDQSPAKKFGGTSGNDPDFFKIKFEGYQNGNLVTNTGVDFYLSDFRSSTNSEDFILDTWKFVTLSSLGRIDSIKVSFSSSDIGQYGINTPTYFCIDTENDFTNSISLPSSGFLNRTNGWVTNTFLGENISISNRYDINSLYGNNWEKGFAYSTINNTTLAGYDNQYASSAGKGFENSEVYVLGRQNSVIKLNTPNSITGTYITNTTYAYLSMKNGDQFAKKFGGSTGNDADYFKLTAIGFKNGATTLGVDFYLADFRDSDISKDFILNTWEWMPLTALGIVDSVQFVLNSSDFNTNGINTPLYFALDNFTLYSPTTSIETVDLLLSDLQIYPNPCTDKLYIKSDIELINITIYDSFGSKILNIINENVIDISSLKPGIYIVDINNSKRTKIVKI